MVIRLLRQTPDSRSVALAGRDHREATGPPNEGMPRGGELRTLQKLLTVDVPDLANLSINDVIAIRHSSECFERFRSALGSALSRLRSLPEDVMDRDCEVRLLNEELYEVRRAVDVEVQRSPTLQQAKVGLIGFAVGALSAVALSAWVPPAAAIAHGGLVTAANLVLSFLRKTQQANQVKSTEALQRHFYVFESANDRARGHARE